MLLAILLAGMGGVPLGEQDGRSVFTLTIELADLGIQFIKVIGTLRSRPHPPVLVKYAKKPISVG
jgi:hypothetical protein